MEAKVACVDYDAHQGIPLVADMSRINRRRKWREIFHKRSMIDNYIETDRGSPYCVWFSFGRQ